MLATILLLAQLVLPGPPSGPIQPPGMICLGECAGPVVWGPAERGRLVVACDMRSDTCSDGRRITTTRATPVPCEVAPGVWEMVGVDEGCYSVRGLESWAQNTSYLSWGAELDRSPWRAVDGATLAKQDGFYRITGTASNSRMIQTGIPLIPGPHTLACVLRTDEPGTHTRLRIFWGSGGPIIPVPVTSTWASYSITQTVPEGATENTSVHVYSGVGTVDIIGCWLTKTDTPGRACWGGEAPVTCAADQHTISTEGWPTTHGSIEIVFRIDEAPRAFVIILDGRSSNAAGFNLHYDKATGRLNHRQNDRIMEGPTITLGTWYRVRLDREGGDARMYVNGVLEASESDWPAWSYPYQSGVARLGRHSFTTDFYLNGPISSLRVRRFE